jgi:sulfane dehydrogenase subunit SoxC
VVTSVCPENPLRQQGYHELEGIAWTGRGKIKRVDVSFDGGVTWRAAKLKGMVLDKALTRFSFDWNWDGSPALIQSRAVDETGYVQPTLGQLKAVRGTSSIYHKNAIQTWQVLPNGEVKNVQIS